MNKIIIFLVISVILTSCQTQKQSLN
ncbi:lipoprotein, partial [Riemerella anatipestifer]